MDEETLKYIGYSMSKKNGLLLNPIIYGLIVYGLIVYGVIPMNF